MERKDFIKSIGVLGATLPILGFKSLADPMDEPSNNDLLSGDCEVSPPETAGPYPAPSSISTSTLVRTNITEGTQTGIPLSLTINVLNINDECNPVSAGYRVDIWQCNKRGYYSAYAGQPGIDGTQNTTGQTWLRGIQYTDANGQVQFTSIYPGWYTPRATHLHVQVYDASNNLLLTTQLAFPDAINTTVNTYYATSGTNPTTNSSDMVFSDSIADQLMTVTGSTSAGYTAIGEVRVAGTALGIDDNNENGGQFSVAVAPNPVSDNAKIHFNLIQPSKVSIEVFDITGRSIMKIREQQFGQGQNDIDLKTSELSAGTYIYKIFVSNVNGDFIQGKQFIKK